MWGGYRQRRVSQSISNAELKGEHGAQRCIPGRSFALRMIEHAIEEAKHTCHGRPTSHALFARQWIMRKPNWSDRAEFYGSFEWCCHWLSRDIELVRTNALAEVDAATQTAEIVAMNEQAAAAEPQMEMCFA